MNRINNKVQQLKRYTNTYYLPNWASTYSHGKQDPGPDDELEDVLQGFDSSQQRLMFPFLRACFLISIVHIVLQDHNQFAGG